MTVDLNGNCQVDGQHKQLIDTNGLVSQLM